MIFPIFINFDASFIKKDRKVYYSISFFCVKAINGFAARAQDGISIRLTKKKTVIIKYSQLFCIRNKIKPLRDYHLLKFNSLCEIGFYNNFLGAIQTGYLLDYISKIISWFLYYKKPFFSLDNRITVYEGENVINFYATATVVLNLLMVIISYIKIIMGKMLYAIRKRIRQNQ